MGVVEIGLIYTALTLVLLFSGMPIAFALGSSAVIIMYFFMPATNIHLIAETIFGELENFTLLTIPLFILMGLPLAKPVRRWICMNRPTAGCTACQAAWVWPT